MSATSVRIVAIIDDDHHVRESIQDLLETAGYVSVLFPSAEAFLSDLSNCSVDCILADVQMPGMSGIELLEVLEKKGNGPPILIMTSHADNQTRAAAMRHGASAFLPKPLDTNEMLNSLEQAVAERPRHLS